MKKRENTTWGNPKEGKEQIERDREREEGEHCVRVSIRKQFSSFHDQIVSEKPNHHSKLNKN